jgi:predicted O-methyltransferase YrrM
LDSTKIIEKLTINKSAIEDEDITELAKYQESWCKPNFMPWDKEAGDTEYKLYSYLSKLINSPYVLDIGTLFGGSALALSANSKSLVYSYDLMSIETHEPGNFFKDNVTLFVGNFMNDLLDYKNINLIVIDVDPHDGLQEPPMVEFIVDKGFKGLILLDDIHLNSAMNEMWDNFEYEKYDATEVGHFSGTGILNIGNKYELEFVKGE